MSQNNFIRKYGVVEGMINWESYLYNAKSGYSIVSQTCFKLFEEYLLHFDIYPNSLYATKNREYCTYCKELEKAFKYDYVDRDSKFCIEFNGDLWHGNPKIYSPDDIPKLRTSDINSRKTAKELWLQDEYKNNFLRDKGYHVVVVWESDFTSDKDTVIKYLYGEYVKCNRKLTV